MLLPHTSPDLRILVEQEVSRQVDALRYREPAMLAHGLRVMLGEKPTEFPNGILIEDERDEAGDEDKNRLRVSSQAKPYIDDLRRAVILERWTDQILTCSGQSAAREASLLWETPAALEANLSASYIGQIEGLETRLAGIFQAIAAIMEQGDDYLGVLWNWLRTRSDRDPEKRPRFVHVTDRVVAESLCRTYLNRDLVLPDEIDTALQQCGFASVRAKMRRERTNNIEAENPDGLLEPKDAAKLLGITVATLHNKKSRGDLPKSLYVHPPGSRIKYRRKALLAWREGQPSVERLRR
jgi:hypothetical protein